MLRNILVPTDGTENSQQAIDRAVDLAIALDSNIHMLSVAPSRGGELKQDQIRSDPTDAAEEAIQDTHRRAEQEGVEIRSEIKEGEPEEEILRYADDEPIDLIVMGTHGRTGLDRVLLGSTAEKVVRNAHVPVMTVPPEDKEASMRNR